MGATAVLQQIAMRGMLAAERVCTGASFLPLGDRYMADPYAVYARLRKRDPVHRSLLIPGWILTRYADIEAVLRDARVSADERKRNGYEKELARRVRKGLQDPDRPDTLSMLQADPPDHTRLRGLVSRAFTPRTVEGMRGRVEEIVTQHLDAVADQGGMEVINALAFPLPVTVIAEMLGIPPEDRARFKRWSDDIISAMGISSDEDSRRVFEARRELRAYLAEVAEERRREPREDLISGLVAAEAEGERLTANELYETCELLLIAGHETTTNLIGNGLLALLRNPAQWRLLCEDPSLIDGAIEELLRYESPVQATTRVAGEPMEIGCRQIKQGEQIVLMLGAANRDPAPFEDPDRLDVTRRGLRHVAFGHGIHYCLGAPLARMEGAIAFRALVERFPDMRLDDGATLQWKPNPILRGLQQLPVRF